MDNNTPDNFSKPSFDGRQGYHDIIRWHIMNISQAMVTHNHELWFRLLEDLYLMVNPFIKTEHAKEIELVISKVQKRFRCLIGSVPLEVKSQIHMYLDNDLQTLQKKVYLYGKHLFLPTEEEETEFDLDRFDRESDM